MGSSKHTKTFFGKMFNFFLLTLMKNTNLNTINKPKINKVTSILNIY